MKPIAKADLIDKDQKYDYQPELTRRLDGHMEDFDQAVINDITLWKVNRYPVIGARLLADLNAIKKTATRYSRPKVQDILIRLLACRGIQLPMASTYLRFKNPRLFQIIDQRVYRAIYGKEMDLPGAYNVANRQKLAAIYFAYLCALRKSCATLGIPFEESDRILYNADKRMNKAVKLKNY
ncbi:MAG: hypothetical protein WCK89_13790 [bacterium]